MCISLTPGVQQQACYKAVEAAAKQSGIQQAGDSVESVVSAYGDSTVRSLVGANTVNLLGSTVYIVKMVQTQQLNLEWSFK